MFNNVFPEISNNRRSTAKAIKFFNQEIFRLNRDSREQGAETGYYCGRFIVGRLTDLRKNRQISFALLRMDVNKHGPDRNLSSYVPFAFDVSPPRRARCAIDDSGGSVVRS